MSVFSSLAHLPKHFTVTVFTALILTLVAPQAMAGTAAAQAEVTFELYVIDAIFSSGPNMGDPADVLVGASFVYTPADTSGTGGTGVTGQSQAVSVRGVSSGSPLVSQVVGPSGIQFSTPNTDPATVADTFSLSADATIPGGTGNADATNNINAIIDIVNQNTSDVDVTFSIMARVAGAATTDGVAGDDASASSNIQISSTSGDFSTVSITRSDMNGCTDTPGIPSYCDTIMVPQTTVTLFGGFDDAVFIDPTGGNMAFAFATAEAPPVAETVNVPMPPWALMLMAVSLLAVGVRTIPKQD